MSKKLLIAVFTFGLFLIGSAILADDNPVQKEREVLQTHNPSAPLHNDLKVLPPFSDEIEKPVPTNLQPVTGATLLPPPWYCERLWYWSSISWYQNVPTSHPVDSVNMRFTPAEGYACTLVTAFVAVYPSGFVGTPDLEVFVWDDDGLGDPAALRVAITIPYASLPAGLDFVVVDLTPYNLVYTDGAEFHIGASTEATSAAAGNRIALLMDDAEGGTGRHRINYMGTWTTWTVDYAYLIEADICCADLPYSECYRQEYDCNVYYGYLQPSPYGDELYNMRFSPECPETLTNVGVAFYQAWSEGAPDAEIWVTSSVGGFPDLSDILYSTVIPNAGLSWFPDYTDVDVTAENLIMRDDFHVGWSVVQNDPGDILVGLSDDGSCGTLRSSMWYDGGFKTMPDVYGDDCNFLIYADLCKDEFCICDRIINYCDPYWVYSMPSSSGSGRIAGYQKIEHFGLGCRLEQVRVAIYDFGDPWNYTYSADLQICESDMSDLPVLPPMHDLEIGTGTAIPYVIFPGFNTWDVLSLNILFDSPLYVGIKTNHPAPVGNTTPDWYLVGDDDACGGDNAVVYYEDGTFVRYTGSNFWIDAYVCCVPPPERDCNPERAGEDWNTTGHDMMRTAASFNSTGDAQCKQALSWMHADPVGFIYGRPIIYDGIVLAPYNDKLQAFDITDGTLLWTISGLPYIGAGFRNSVTVKDGFVYFGGGNGRSFSRADVYTGSTAAVDGGWNRGVLNIPGYEACAGNTTYTTSVILNCDGTDVVFFGTAAGELYAVDATTGLKYGGWVTANPVMLDGDILHTLSSNGVDVLYAGTDGIYGTGYGTIYAIDACTGDILWSLGEGDLYGYELDGDEDMTTTTESFQGPIGVDPQDGSIYVQTAFEGEAVSGGPSGAHYKIDPGGSIVWGVGTEFPRFTGPVIDANLVIMTTLRGWLSEDVQTEALRKTTGSVKWSSSEEFNAINWVEGALSCEPLERDLLYVGNMDAQLLAINADDGTVEFEYNYDITGSNRGCGTAIDPSHVVFNNRQGDLYVLTEQVDRPRLRILNEDALEPVPFFSPDPHPVPFGPVLMNNGCAELTGTMTADENEPAYNPSSVNPERIRRMQNAANSMLNNSYPEMAKNLVKAIRVDPSTLDAEFTESAYSKDSYSNNAAYGPPAWLRPESYVIPFSLGAGGVLEVTIQVIGPLVTRGPHRCYWTIDSNDDYYLNGAKQLPYVQLGVLGGCLESEDALVFGTSEQNITPVLNTGEFLYAGVDPPIEIDGDNAPYFQGMLVIATEPLGGPADPPFRQAWTSDDWQGGPHDFWNSLLPDVNCFNQCEPYVTPDPIILCRMWDDATDDYVDVEGYAAAYAYIDSVQDFDCYGSGWDWSNTNCPFDNDLTMGLRVDEYMYGVIGEPSLNNVIIFKHVVTNRNSNPVDNVFFGTFDDFDLESNGSDYWYFDNDHAIAWGASTLAGDPNNTKVYGRGTIPMSADCDGGMIGVRTLDAQQALWHDGNIGLDSMYYWCQQAGATYQIGVTPMDASDDRDAWHSLTGHNFAGDETWNFGHYFFGYENEDPFVNATWTDLASLVNEFTGFVRGKIDNDNDVDLADAVALWNYLHMSDPATYPGPRFYHNGDVNCDGNLDDGDVLYIVLYHFCLGPPPCCAWSLPDICP